MKPPELKRKELKLFKYIENGSFTSAKGFKSAGLFCGIKKKRKDLALLYSENECSAAGTFTLNKVKAAPLQVSMETVKSGGKVNAVLINSGNANACTGEKGFWDAVKMQKYCALQLGLKESNVLIASTGVIGQELPMDKIFNGVDCIIPLLSENDTTCAAEAIMTTDKKVKSFGMKISFDEAEINIGAICKGSGMIMPNMATMLAFISTDADIEGDFLQELLSEAVNQTFNKISVDGETSTNDMVILLANGASGIRITRDSAYLQEYKDALFDICRKMATSIISDGEGATKLVTIEILNADTKINADLIGKSVANSLLVKTALYGSDANWGRIISAAGKSGAEFDPMKVAISFNELPVILPGYKLVLDELKATEILSQPEFSIRLDMGCGRETSTWWTCDLTEEYVKINADYRT
jgi:glutamate N-acetyltransferase/amino-acid N-acetyltransferase